MSNTRINPYTGEMENDDLTYGYSKSEIDVMIANLQGQVNTKASTTYVDTEVADLQGQIDTKATATTISGTFVSADIPAKTITVTNGVVTNMI